MRSFVAEVGESSHRVDLGPNGAFMDGEAVEFDLSPPEGRTVRSLIVDGISHRLIAERVPDGSWLLELDGTLHVVGVSTELRHRLGRLAGGAARVSGPRPVEAPMPGLVVAVDVQVGDAVEPGRGVAIVEAMKMENEITSESSGIVRAVLVAPGAVVSKGEVLVELE